MGLGSSAAFSVSLNFNLAALITTFMIGNPLHSIKDNQQKYMFDLIWDQMNKNRVDLIHYTECLIHGKTTGIDYKTILFNKPLFLDKDRNEKNFIINQGYILLGIITGIEKRTAEGINKVEELKRDFNQKFVQIIEDISNCTQKIALYLNSDFTQENNQKLQENFKRNLELLDELGVS